jgi:hypothetical protein
MPRIERSVNWVAMLAVLLVAASAAAQAPEMPKPTKEHEVLSQFVGEWNVTTEMVATPGQPAFKCQGAESTKMYGSFWLVGRGEAAEIGMQSQLTIGYDPKAKKYVGTFFCSEDSTLWKYEGSMDAEGKVLTLETAGPALTDRNKIVKYRETLELKDKDHKLFTSQMQGDDGKWVKVVTMDYRRKK